jgi:hypothetical protein
MLSSVLRANRELAQRLDELEARIEKNRLHTAKLLRKA